MIEASTLLADERRDAIRLRLQAGEPVRAADLAVLFAVSEDTVRRDLREMASNGECRRVYGGALPLSPAAGPLTTRRLEAPERKQRLAAALVPLIPDGATIFIDAGSTNLAIAAALVSDRIRAVVTNAPAVATALADRGLQDIVMIGGRLDPVNGSCVGARTLTEIDRLNPDVYLLGGCGVDHVAGITVFSSEEAEIRRVLAHRSRMILTAAINDKLGTAAPFAVLPPDGLEAVVIERDADIEQERGFARQGVRVIRAGDEVAQW
ncbi:DeoR/GlpR family DNA-binding transcription regulator [Consotaella aegiceratis]|uniref:DeoR/GlpR family DNA-binding transcription regulator n=1 Tax=Consotaella aegiceratis TaxID=3097961 RepID=UPI002F3E99B7